MDDTFSIKDNGWMVFKKRKSRKAALRNTLTHLDLSQSSIHYDEI